MAKFLITGEVIVTNKDGKMTKEVQDFGSVIAENIQEATELAVKLNPNIHYIWVKPETPPTKPQEAQDNQVPPATTKSITEPKVSKKK